MRSLGPEFKTTWAFLALLALFVLPIWVTPAVPGMDTPNHMAMVEILSRQSLEPDWDVHFEDRISVGSPYVTYYALGLGLARFMSATEAHRVIMSAFVLLLPLSFAYLVYSLRPTARWTPLFGFLLIYTDSYFVGFTNFLLTLPLLLFGVALSIRLAKRPEGGLLQSLLLGFVSVLLYMTHPIGCALLPILAGILGLPQLASMRRLVWLVAAWLPGPVLLLIWAGSDSSPFMGGITYLPFDFSLEYLARTPTILMSGWSLFVATCLALVLMVGALPSVFRRLETGSSLFQRLSPFRSPVLGSLAFVLLYFVMPFQVGSTIWLNLRLAVIVWVLIFVVLGDAMVRNWLGQVALIALCLWQLGSVTQAHYAFGQEVDSLLEVVEVMEPHGRILPLVLNSDSEVATPFYRGDERAHFASRFTYYLHFGSYYHLEKSGLSPWMTFQAGLPHVPLGIKSPFLRSRFRIADPFFPDRFLSRLPELAPHFDYILLRNSRSDISAGLTRAFPLLHNAGSYEVYSTD
ncbi:MAG: hypothetical protein VX252_10505 [Myxococcota bacterium]|nr:hypothetical protein [Myxococcota bacterium]